MSLPFNMLSRFVIAFLPRNKCLFISWLEGNDKPLQYLFLPQEPHEKYEKIKTYDTGRWVSPRWAGVQYATREKQINTSRKNKMWELEYKYYYLAFRINSLRCIWNMSIHYVLFFFNFILFLNFTILYWFYHISKWICHKHTCVPHPEPSFLLPPHIIPLGRPSAPSASIQYRASNLDWRLVSYMILYTFQCHSPKSSHRLPLPQSPKDCSTH